MRRANSFSPADFSGQPDQRGFTLLALLALLMLFGITAGVAWVHSAASIRSRNQESTARALTRAREALLDYALKNLNTDSDRVPGYLPCPDRGSGDADNEGRSPSNCGSRNVSVLGRLPWKTLEIEPLRDAEGECLWYALSGTFLSSPATEMLNWDTEGLLQVLAAGGVTPLAGAQSDNRAVAVIFAPGRPLPGQKRIPAANAPVCGGHYDARHYLDSAHGIDNSRIEPGVRAVSRLIAGENGADFNDRLLIVTAADIFNAVEKHKLFRARIDALTYDSANCMASFAQAAVDPADRRLPWAAPLILDDYLNNTGYKDGNNTLIGRLPYNVAQSQTALGPQRRDITNDLLKLVAPGNACSDSVTRFNEWYKNWKDQLFYIVSGSYSPSGHLPSNCSDCLILNNQRRFAAMVLFAGRPLADKKQRRISRGELGSYLEAMPTPDSIALQPKSPFFNDVAWCISDRAEVVTCP